MDTKTYATYNQVMSSEKVYEVTITDFRAKTREVLNYVRQDNATIRLLSNGKVIGLISPPPAEEPTVPDVLRESL